MGLLETKIQEGLFETNACMEQDLYQILSKSKEKLTGKSYVGICYGMVISEEELHHLPYEQYLSLRLEMYKKISEMFQISESGYVVKNEENCCSMIAVIPDEDREVLIGKYILPAREMIYRSSGYEIHFGIGMFVQDTTHLIRTYECAKFAYDLYFFEEENVIEFSGIDPISQLSFEGVYEPLMEEVYSSVVAREDTVFARIETLLEAIGKIHYGNKYAAINRCIMFVGELGKRLRDLNPEAANWRTTQETMQEGLRYLGTYREVKQSVIDYYRYLVPIIYQCVDQGSVNEMIRIKKYIHENYMKDLSIKTMADMVYLSQSYFSTAFKHATGKNFKTYLTEVRMEQGLKLVLRTNLKTYEIAEAVGYKNVRIFVDSFKAAYKMSPLEYRKIFGEK